MAVWECIAARLLEEATHLSGTAARAAARRQAVAKAAGRTKVTGAAASQICWKHLAGRATALPAAANFKPWKLGGACYRALPRSICTAPPMNLAQVTDWLRRQAAEYRFQVEDEGAPVQVMGMLEAAGLRFDHLWIMGLDDEALPAPANPNPFLRFLCSASIDFRTRPRSANWSSPIS